MRHVIIGTAGHIDHGKTTLIKALTGRSTDNLPEEIERGISINLGFTYFDLPNSGTSSNANTSGGCKRIGIIDVPGHERFIKNMLAGAAGIDIALLVIAANEGVKPQTTEHVDILEFLDIKERLIVLTKCGLADELMRELVIDDIRDRMLGTAFEDAEIVPVDSQSGYNLDTLIAKIGLLAERAGHRNEAASARLNIDRVFSAKGFGTVVTGTLSEGIIRVNDELELYPKSKPARIRNIQVHNTNTDAAYAGQRTSLNIANLKPDEIHRGDVLAAKASMETTALLDVKISLVSHTDWELKLWSRLRIYVGTEEILARLVPLEERIIRPGESAFCQLRLEKKIAVKKNDRFVIRSYSPMETIGGGVIIDPCPVKHGGSPELIQALTARASGSLSDSVESFVRGSERYVTVKDAANHLSMDEQAVKTVIHELVNEKLLLALGDFYFHIDKINSFMEVITAELDRQHKKFSLKAGIQKEEIRTRTRLPLKAKEFDLLLTIMEREGLIQSITTNSIALFGYKAVYNPSQLKIKNEIEKSLMHNGFTPPGIDELTRGGKAYIQVLDSMIPEEVIRLDANIVIHRQYYLDALTKLLDFFNSKAEITLSEFRDAINSTRKYTMAILEDFDKKNITARIGEKRVKGRNYKQSLDEYFI